MRYGYDIGGAEYPIDPEHFTVVDIIQPRREDGTADTEADWFRRDLNSRSWTEGLEARPAVYVGRVLRYIDPHPSITDEIDSILTHSGTVTFFDRLDVLDPILMRLQLQYGYKLVESELCNIDEVSDFNSEYRVVLYKP